MKILFYFIYVFLISSISFAQIDLTKISNKESKRNPAERNASYFKSLYPDQNCNWTPHPISKAQSYDVIENTGCDPKSPQKIIHGSVTCLGSLGEITYNDVYCLDQTNAFECLTQGQFFSKKQFIPRSLKPSDRPTQTNRGVGG